MIATYSKKQRWVKIIDENFLKGLGKSNSKKIVSLLGQKLDNTINYEFSLLDTMGVKWFEVLYLKNMASKHNPNPFNIFNTTLGKERIIYPYYLLTIREDNEIIGGTIFTLREDRLSIAYRTYPSEWNKSKLTCTPSLYAEYIVTKHAFENQKAFLVHGVDSNPYGVHSNIGVAIYKLSVGCWPEIRKSFDEAEINIKELPKNSLILLKPEYGTRITKGYLVGDDEVAQKYSQLFKYPTQLQVTLIKKEYDI